MSPSDRNPFARQDSWPRQTAEPTHIGPSPASRAETASQAAALQPRPLSKNSIFSGSAILVAPPPRPEEPARPEIELAPPGEPPPPLRTTTFVAPPPAVRRRRSLRRHVPLIGSLATAAIGFAVVAFVMTRPAPELVVPPPHHPTHLAVAKVSAPAAEAPQPVLRGLMQRIASRRGRPGPTPVATEPVAAPAMQAITAPAAAPPPPHYTPPTAPAPDAPIATRPPYS